MGTGCRYIDECKRLVLAIAPRPTSRRPAFVEAEHEAPLAASRVSTGIPGLDDVTNGGYFWGAPPGPRAIAIVALRYAEGFTTSHALTLHAIALGLIGLDQGRELRLEDALC